ncbi:MAG: hemerythrin domain-containing protein [Muribaculaceae bacterium]|nr:hemerythrin domain-containing protein [Muribaculaceae bacterium]
MKNRTYTSSDKMLALISNDYRHLHVLSRFGIPLGFHDQTIEEVCRNAGVDCDTFLTMVNFINTDEKPEISKLSLSALLHYLKQSHSYFLDFYLPSIRRKLLEAITMKDTDVSFLIIKLFDEYVDGVREHMEEEEQHLFSYVEALIDNQGVRTDNLPVYSKHHEEVGSKLRELKNIIIRYCPADSSANLLNAALYDIFRCEEELGSHCRIEDHLLLPAIQWQKMKMA